MTLATQATPHQSLFSDSFLLFRFFRIRESYLRSKYDLERCVYEFIKRKIRPHLWGKSGRRSRSNEV